jgi:hypothetical protein
MVGALLIAALAVVSCTGATAPGDSPQAALERSLQSSLAAGPVTYALARAEQQTAPVVIFDHTCGGTRWVTAVHDTIRLSADGAFRRSAALERTANGAAESLSTTVTIGRWQWVHPDDAGYTPASPAIMISSATENGRSIGSYRVRVSDAHTLVMNAGMGGSCPGSPNDARNADFIFSRQR